MWPGWKFNISTSMQILVLLVRTFPPRQEKLVFEEKSHDLLM